MKSDGSDVFRELPALLDTGADITLVPIHTVEALGLQQITDDLELHDATGGVLPDAEMYVVRVQFGGLVTHNIDIATTRAATIFIGRDILDDYVATFRGPAQTFTVT
jgi:Aspartyl protease